MSGVLNVISSYKTTAAGGITAYPTSNLALSVSYREMPGMGYTGIIFRIRRSSDNAELDFYQGATEGSWNTTRGGGGTDLITWIGSNDAHVVRWYRQDGSASYLEQMTAGNQPKLIVSGTLQTSGGYPAILFDGSLTYFMVINGTPNVSNQVPHMRFYVGNRTGSSKYGMVISKSGSDLNGWMVARWNDNYIYQRTTDGQDKANSTSTTTSFERLSAFATSTSAGMDTNAGNVAITHTETSYTAVNFNHYGRWDAAGIIADFKIVEDIIYSTYDSGDYTDIADFMDSEFGL